MGLDSYNKEVIKKVLDTLKSLKIVDISVCKSTDCMVSSIILAELLKQLNTNFTLNFISDNDQLKTSKNPSILISDVEKDLPAYLTFCKNTIKINPDLIMNVTAEETPTSLILYLAARDFDSSNKSLSYLPLASNINNLRNPLLLELLAESINDNVIVSGTSLALIDSSTRPLHKALEYTINPFIPGISNKEDSAVSLLSSLSIKIKDDDKFTRLIDLDATSLSKLTEAILIRNPELSTRQLTKTKYYLKSEDYSSAFKDLDELNLLFDVSLLSEKYSMPLAKCLSPKNYKNRSLDVLRDFRIKILQVLEWFYDSKAEAVEKDGYVMIKYNKHLEHSILKTASRFIYSNFYLNSGKSIILSALTDSGKIYSIHDEEANGYNIMKLIQDLDTKKFKMSNYKNTIIISFNEEFESELAAKLDSYLNAIKIEQVVT